MKPLSKKELALKLHMSSRTLSNYLNINWYDQLIEVGYLRHQKLLSVNIIKKIKEIWGDFDE